MDFQDVRTLSPDDRLAIASALIESNRLRITAYALRSKFEDNRLLVRFDPSTRTLLAATGYKEPDEETAERILSATDDAFLVPRAEAVRFLSNLGDGCAMEKGWGFNASDKDAFRQMNRALFQELEGKGYGAHAVFALVRDGNEAACRHLGRLGFTAMLRIRSPFTSNTLIVHVLTNPAA